jgi:nucleotide-binding universal stress UspA family protein
MLAIKQILHPTDFSERSELAFRLACSLARDYGARLLLLHVAEAPTAVYGEGIILPPPEESWSAAREKLYQLRPKHAGVMVEHMLVEGIAAVEILRVARESKVDAIVMGTHGRTGFSRALMGSVSEQVLRTAPCPVVTVRGQLKDKLAAAAAEAPLAAAVHD